MTYLVKLTLLLIPIIGFVFFSNRIKKVPASTAVNVYLIMLAGVSLLNMGKYVYENYRQPPAWDFQVFWLNGQVAAHGLNFYVPQNYHTMAQSLNPSEGFVREILDVGFWYPPMSMFLFVPLGWFNLSTAYLLWQILSLLLCIGCIYMLWNLFLHEHGILGFLLVAALLLRLDPARATFSLSQTNFLALLFFLFFWQYRSKEWSGIWLGLCVIVKPYMALLYLYPFLTRKWKMLAYAISGLLVLTVLSILAFGLDAFTGFFVENPTAKMPNLVYTENVNQSLLATILRANPDVLANGSPLANPLFMAIALTLMLITVWVVLRKRDNHSEEWIILALLFLALIAYPATLMHYSVFLIIPTALLLKQFNRTAWQRITATLIIFGTYLLSGFNGTGDYTFYANALAWAFCIVFAAGLKLPQSVPTTANPEQAS